MSIFRNHGNFGNFLEQNLIRLAAVVSFLSKWYKCIPKGVKSSNKFQINTKKIIYLKSGPILCVAYHCRKVNFLTYCNLIGSNAVLSQQKLNVTFFNTTQLHYKALCAMACNSNQYWPFYKKSKCEHDEIAKKMLAYKGLIHSWKLTIDHARLSLIDLWT